MMNYDISIRKDRFSKFMVVRIQNISSPREILDLFNDKFNTFEKASSLVAFGNIREMKDGSPVFCSKDLGENYEMNSAKTFMGYVTDKDTSTFLFDNGRWFFCRPGTTFSKTFGGGDIQV